MSAQAVAKHVPLVNPDGACLKCGTRNSPNNHFCRNCGCEVHLTAEKLPPEKCLHKLIRQKNLYIYNYCPTCCEAIDSLSTDECGIML